jgi:hypothetical protein
MPGRVAAGLQPRGRARDRHLIVRVATHMADTAETTTARGTKQPPLLLCTSGQNAGPLVDPGSYGHRQARTVLARQRDAWTSHLFLLPLSGDLL